MAALRGWRGVTSPGLLLGSLLLAGCAAGGDQPGGPAGPSGPTGATGPTGVTGPTGPTGPASTVALGEALAGDLTIALGSDRTLGTGLTLLTVAVSGAGGAIVPDATVRLEVSRPAAAGGTALAAPALGAPVAGADGRHRQLVAFPEPAPAAAGWTCAVTVTRPAAGEVTATFAGLVVVERQLAPAFEAGPDRYLLAVRFDGGLVAGLNPVTASLHRSADQGATWAPVADATFAVEPFMPSMGHGASGSVAPVPTATPGEYRGALAFSMAGDWETTFTVSRAGAVLGRPVVTVYF